MNNGIHYDMSQQDKLGNAVIYLADNCEPLSKTKLLKLIYLVEESCIKKYGFPFFNIDFELWRLGPVYKDLFIDLSSKPAMLAEYITTEEIDGGIYIKSKKDFSDDEFSEVELEILKTISDFGKTKTAEELIRITHREHHPWYETAKKNDVLDLFENKKRNSTDIKVDMTVLFGDNNERRDFYLSNVEYKAYTNSLKDNINVRRG